MNNLINQEIIDTLRNISSRVYTNLGSGHNEKIYHKAMKYELDIHNIPVDMEFHVSVKYQDSLGKVHNLESERIDLFIHSQPPLIVELKAVQRNIQEMEKVQIYKYFKELQKSGITVPVGVIINFPQPNSKDTRSEIDFEIVSNNLISS